MNQENPIDDFIKEIESRLPELSSSTDLVQVGLYSSEAALCKSRQRGDTPAFIKMSAGRIRYPRKSVIDFLKKRTFQADCPNKASTKEVEE